jgi:hypothetical protein
MKWDEERYGLEYDLDLFNIVAVDDFNSALSLSACHCCTNIRVDWLTARYSGRDGEQVAKHLQLAPGPCVAAGAWACGSALRIKRSLSLLTHARDHLFRRPRTMTTRPSRASSATSTSTTCAHPCACAAASRRCVHPKRGLTCVALPRRTGNRVTCRDWFQLSLKEGLTVYRCANASMPTGNMPLTRLLTLRCACLSWHIAAIRSSQAT